MLEPGRIRKMPLFLRAGALALAVFAAAAAPAAPIETYGHLPSVEDVTLSPDGSRIAFIRTQGNVRAITVASLADRKLLGAFRIGEEKLRGIEWADDDHLLIYSSTTALPLGFIGMQHEWTQLQVYDVTAQRLHFVPDDREMPDNIKTMNVLGGPVMIRRSEGRTELYIHGYYAEDHIYPMLMRVDIQTGRQKLLRTGEAETEGWLVDGAGNIAAEMNYEENRRTWSLKVRRDGKLAQVATGQADIELPSVLGFGPTEGTLLVAFPEHGGRVWRLVSLADGSIGAPMSEGESLDGPIEDPQSLRMIGGYRITDLHSYVFFDPKVQKRWDSILHAFAGEYVRFVSASADFRKFIVLVQGARHGFTYEFVDLDGHKAEPVGEVYEGLGPPLEVRRITYPAGDALSIPAYLTLPRGKPEKALPLVVLPHGGPAGRDTVEFDYWAQAFADSGYAVLQPNFRGSTVSEAFLSAGYGQFGRKMQTDLSDGVRYLVQQGMVDPARVCIVGGSYGGYAALAGVTLDPAAYRCAVAVAGIADLRRFLQWVDERHLNDTSTDQRYLNRFLGVTGADDPALAGISPALHIDKVTAPVLLIHGRDDTVVPYEQSELMFKALKKAGKDVQMVELEQEDHWLSRSETRLQTIKSIMGFLRAHNPPD